MLKLILLKSLTLQTLLCVVDPLEQFETVSVIAGLSTTLFTNLGVILILNTGIMYLFYTNLLYSESNTYAYSAININELIKTMLRENIYIKKQQYFTIIFYLFNTLLIANLVGLLPFSFTITSSFVVTLFLSLTHFLGVNIVGGNRHKWQLNNLFLPSGAPLAIAPFLIFIEAVSYVARIFSLSIRLFANMMSGHALLKILIGFAWTLLSSGTIFTLLFIFPWLIVTAVTFLELLIAFLQAYVFTILVTLYINDVLTFHD